MGDPAVAVPLESGYDQKETGTPYMDTVVTEEPGRQSEANRRGGGGLTLDSSTHFSRKSSRRGRGGNPPTSSAHYPRASSRRKGG